MLRSEFIQSAQSLLSGVSDMLPKIIAALFFIILGLVFGLALGRVVSQIAQAVKADEWLTKAGVDKYLARAGYKLNSAAFLGWLAKLFVVIIFLQAAFEILGLSQVNVFLSQALIYIPQVIVAAIILFVASITSDILSGMVVGTSKAIGSHVAQLLGTVTRVAIWMFAIIMTLSQLGIATQYMYTLFAGFVAMLALAGGLAFGLGGKDAAASLIKNIQEEMRQGRRG
jgi:hypothetical protein